MSTTHRAARRGYVLLIAVVTAGCQTTGHTAFNQPQPVPLQIADSESPDPAVPSGGKPITVGDSLPLLQENCEVQDEVVRSMFSVDAGAVQSWPVVASGQSPRLEMEPLVAEVLSRHPDIRSAIAAWRAAAERCPQEISLDDPMFGLMLGPGSWGSDEVETAYTLEASQKIPWPGKRQLRGNIARAQANAAFYTIDEQRLRIAEATRLAYAQYFLAHRQLVVLAESTSLLGDFRQIAMTKYESAEVQQQDVLIADVELAELARRRLELLRAERVAKARINTLLLVSPAASLPPPPESMPVTAALPPADELRILALEQRPELAAQAAQIRATRYSAALARKEFLPDTELVARYDAFWQEEPLRPMVGMNVNVPVYKAKRRAAVREATAKTAEQQAAMEARINEITFLVDEAYQRVQESQQTVTVYQEQILPKAEHSVAAAQASYVAGRLDFLRLIESQRQLLAIQDRHYEAIAEHHQRLAELIRQVGTDIR